MELDTLKDLYIEELKDLYSAEKQLVKALPKMIKATKHPELKAAFKTHLQQTAEHARRLEQICEELGVSPRGKKCVGMEGLIEEGSELIKEKPDDDVLDAGLISAAQHVEHYEMAGYGTVRTYARQLGYESQAELLQRTLDEEGETDHLLTAWRRSRINLDADGLDRAAKTGFEAGFFFGVTIRVVPISSTSRAAFPISPAAPVVAAAPSVLPGTP